MLGAFKMEACRLYVFLFACVIAMVGPICVSVGICLPIVIITFALHIFWLEQGSTDLHAMPQAYIILCYIGVLMPLQGGIRQQLQRERPAADVADEPPAKLKTHRYGGRDNRAGQSVGDFLKSMYLIGRITAPEFQEGAAASSSSSRDGSDPLSLKVGKAANAGANPNSAHRDIMKILGKRSDRPEVYDTDIWFWDKQTQSRTKQSCHFLLPSETLDYEARKSGIEDWVGIRDNACLQSTFESWCNHPQIKLTHSDPDIVALGMWGDSAVISPSESLFILLINCLSGICHKRFWVCAFGKKVVCQCGCFGRCTFDSIFRVLQWDLGVMLCGERPAIRDDGVPFSQSKRTGDQKRHKARIKHKRFKMRGGVIQKRGDAFPRLIGLDSIFFLVGLCPTVLIHIFI